MNQKIMYLFKVANKRLVQFQEKFLRNEWVLGTPFHLVLETGNICNLQCPLCPTPWREKKIPRGRLTFENAKRIIDQFPMLLHVNLSLWGEPFLNKDTFDIISYAHENGIEVLVQSNLNIFDRQKAERLVESNLDILQISLDGASQETYEKYRVGGNFEKVMKHIRLIREVQAASNDFTTRIIWKMVVNRFNEHEIEKVKTWAQELAIEYKFVEIYTPASAENEWKPQKNLEKSKHVHTDEVPSCYSLWQVATINFNGDVFPCCSEFSPKDVLGNVFQEPFQTIWNNEKYRSLRRQNKKEINCRACHVDKTTNWYRLWMN